MNNEEGSQGNLVTPDMLNLSEYVMSDRIVKCKDFSAKKPIEWFDNNSE